MRPDATMDKAMIDANKVESRPLASTRMRPSVLVRDHAASDG